MLGETRPLRARRHHRGRAAKVRAQLRARFVYDSDSVTDIAHQLGYFETIDQLADLYQELLIPRLAHGDARQVNAAARRYLTRRQPDDRMVRTVSHAHAEGTAMPLHPLRHVLSNGLVLLAKENAARRRPSRCSWASRPARTTIRSGRRHRGACVARVLDRGTRGLSAEAIADELDGRGAVAVGDGGPASVTVSATCLAEDFERRLALVGRRRRSRPSSSGHRGRHAARRTADRDPAGRRRSGCRRRRRADGRLYAGPSVRPARPRGTRPDGRAARRRDDLAQFHPRWFTPGGHDRRGRRRRRPRGRRRCASRPSSDWNAPPRHAVPVPAPLPPVARRLRTSCR